MTHTNRARRRTLLLFSACVLLIGLFFAFVLAQRAQNPLLAPYVFCLADAAVDFLSPNFLYLVILPISILFFSLAVDQRTLQSARIPLYKSRAALWQTQMRRVLFGSTAFTAAAVLTVLLLWLFRGEPVLNWQAEDSYFFFMTGGRPSSATIFGVCIAFSLSLFLRLLLVNTVVQLLRNGSQRIFIAGLVAVLGYLFCERSFPGRLPLDFCLSIDYSRWMHFNILLFIAPALAAAAAYFIGMAVMRRKDFF